MDCLDLWVLQGDQGQRDQRALLEQMDLMANLDLLVLMVHLVTEALLGSLDLMDLL